MSKLVSLNKMLSKNLKKNFRVINIAFDIVEYIELFDAAMRSLNMNDQDLVKEIDNNWLDKNLN